jgi:hypothetical protein
MKRIVVRVQDNSLIQLLMQICEAYKKIGCNDVAEKLMQQIVLCNHVDDVMQLIEHHAVVRNAHFGKSQNFWKNFNKQKPKDFSKFFDDLLNNDNDDDDIFGNNDDDNDSKK